MKISRTSGLRIFNLQSSIQDVLARASTSWITLSTYLENFRKSCQRILNLPSRSWIALSADLKNPKGRPGVHVVRIKMWMCTCTACNWPGGKMLLTPLHFFVDLRAGQDGRFSNRKSGRSSIFNAGGEALMSLEQIVRFLGDQD